MFDNSDDYDFLPSGSSRLASLFDNVMLPVDEPNNSLTYTAPKQPKPRGEPDVNESERSKAQSSVVVAKVVSLWKLEDNTYKSLGKRGLAVIRSGDLKLHELIAYKARSDIIVRSKINSNFSFYHQRDKFSSFYDDKDNINWLIKFENIDDLTSFSRVVESHGAKIINVEESQENKETTLIKPAGSVTQRAVQKPEVHPRTNNVKECQEIPERDTSLEVHSDSSSSEQKANILSRMAKMGQQILPHEGLKNQSTDVSDSEWDNIKKYHKPPPRKSKRSSHQQEKGAIVQNDETVSQTVCQSQIVASTSSPNLSHPLQICPQNIPNSIMYHQSPYDGFNNFILSQNSELKMNLAQISEKLDSVLSGKSTKEDSSISRAKIKALELKTENLSSELEKYEIKYNDLLSRYEDFEKATKDNSEITSLKALLQSMSEEIYKLKLDVSAAEAKNELFNELEAELEKHKNIVKDHEKTIDIQKLKLKDFEGYYEANKNNKNMQGTIDILNSTVANLKLKLKDFEEYFHKNEKGKLKERKQKSNMISDVVKQQMNDMYQSMLKSFSEESTYPASEIQEKLAQNLKDTTFRIIEDLENKL